MKTHKIYHIFLAAVFFQFAALVSSAQQVTIYASIKGQKQGEIKGDVMVRGAEGKIECYEYSDAVISPRDAASGLPTGRRTQKPLTIITHFDSSTPRLLQAMYSNENLTSVELELFRANGAMANGMAGRGETMPYATIKLTNASIAEIEQTFNGSATVPAERTVNVRIVFTFQKIEFTYLNGGVTAMDDWQAKM